MIDKAASMPEKATPVFRWSGLALAFAVVIGIGWWLGGQQIAPSETKDALMPRPRSPMATPLGLPEPPKIEVIAIESSAPPVRSAQVSPPMAGGPPQAVIQRMWETTLKQPWKSGTTPLTAKSWKITGLVQRGSESKVIVLVDGQTEPVFYKVGDSLPGGARLVWIKPDTMGVVLRDGRRLEVAVLQP